MDNGEYVEALQSAALEDLAKAGRDDLSPGHITIFDPVVMLNRDAISLMPGVRIDSFVKLEGGWGLYVGRNVHIASFCHIGIGGGHVYLGDFSAFASGVRIVSGSNKTQGLSCSAAAPSLMQVVDRDKVRVERFAFVCTGAILLPGTTIGEGAIVAAGAVVRGHVPAWEVWGGVPARQIGVRTLRADHYQLGRDMGVFE